MQYYAGRALESVVIQLGSSKWISVLVGKCGFTITIYKMSPKTRKIFFVNYSWTVHQVKNIVIRKINEQ